VIVVSNTSPLTNLATIGQFNLLRQLYDHAALSSCLRLAVFGRVEASISRTLDREIAPDLKAIGQLLPIAVCWHLMFLWVEVVVNDAENREECLYAVAI